MKKGKTYCLKKKYKLNLLYFKIQLTGSV